MNKKNLFTIAIIVILLQALTILLAIKWAERKIAYVDTIKLVNEYKLKKDLEKKAESSLLFYKGKVDSIEAVYKKTPENKQLEMELTEGKNQFSYIYESINKEINIKIWERLNPLINKYGKDNDYDILIGANGMGTILYGSQKLDVTEEIMLYINKDYENGN